MNAPSRPFNQLDPATQAGILCNDPTFQKFAAMRCGLPGQQFSASAAARYLRQCCRVESRRELNTSDGANHQFQKLRTEFDVYRGRIAQPRRGA